MNRREAIIAGTLVGATGLLHASEQTKESKRVKKAYGELHTIEPLPFDAKSMKGISENVIVSHHNKNYAGAVKKLRLIQKQIVALPQQAHPIELGALKKEELIALNSKLLHELYFDNLGGNGKMNQGIEAVIRSSFGSTQVWHQDFTKTARSLGGGSGWVILSYIPQTNTLINQIASDHTDSVATGIPLLVLDMYEHAYHMDYGANAGKYIEAFMQNINWDSVLKRWETC